jgi:hypothetical protein
MMRATLSVIVAAALLGAGFFGLDTVAVPVTAEGRGLVVTPITREGQVLVTFELNDGVTAEVRDAIHSGLPTTFSYGIAVSRGAGGWFDRTLASVSVAASVRFDNLTRRYQLARTLDGRVEDSRPTEDQEVVKRWLTRFDQVPVLTTDALETNGEYAVRVKAQARPQHAWFFWPWARGAVSGNAKFTFIQ